MADERTHRNRMISCDDPTWDAFAAAVGRRKISSTIRALMLAHLGHPDAPTLPRPDVTWAPVADITAWEPTIHTRQEKES